MRTLIAFEFKKLLNRKTLWVALALVLAFAAYDTKGMWQSRFGGYVKGLRDASAHFEGQVLTDAVAAQARAMLLRYAQQHPEDFQYSTEPQEDLICPA